MKTRIPFNLTLAFSVFGMALVPAASCFAQTQTVTLAVNAASGSYSPSVPQTPAATCSVASNQIVHIVSVATNGSASFPTVVLNHSSGVSAVGAIGGIYTGLIGISVYPVYGGFFSNTISYWTNYPCLVTLEIETPGVANVISNYVPADAIVVPASVTGNVQIILESSSDLVNWTAASPGTYGTSAGTNRFFRVRAAVSP